MRLTAELLAQSGLGSVSDAEEAAAALAEAAGSKDALELGYQARFNSWVA
jgi:hypothetical protein